MSTPHRATATESLVQSHRPGSEPLRVLSASGQLGYGIPQASFELGLQRQPHFIGCDMGSIDPGPFYLGSGQMAAPQVMVRPDLELVLLGAVKAGIPLIIGSAGTAGAQPQLDATVALVRQIALQHGLVFRLTTIASDVSAAHVIAALQGGTLQPLSADVGGSPLSLPTEAEVLSCRHIVGQCGSETFSRALQTLPDVLIAGRACDTAIFAALPEIIECTSLCCKPAGRDAILAELSLDGFTLESMNPALHATPASVAAHALYEQSDPFEVEEPSGTLRLADARYLAIDDHRTRVFGAQFSPRLQSTLKIEGAAFVGARAVLLAGIADPTMLLHLPEALKVVEQRVRGLLPGDWSMYPHVYGQGASSSSPMTPSWLEPRRVSLNKICCTTATLVVSRRQAIWPLRSRLARSMRVMPTAL
jgi:hypothetical protein